MTSEARAERSRSSKSGKIEAAPDVESIGDEEEDELEVEIEDEEEDRESERIEERGVEIVASTGSRRPFAKSGSKKKPVLRRKKKRSRESI